VKLPFGNDSELLFRSVTLLCTAVTTDKKVFSAVAWTSVKSGVVYTFIFEEMNYGFTRASLRCSHMPKKHINIFMDDLTKNMSV
jgi:hypothetical protein